MKQLNTRNAAIHNLNEKLGLSIPFETESTVNGQDPNSLLFKAEMFEKVTSIKPTPKEQSLLSLSAALSRLEKVIKRGFAFNMVINEDEFEMEVVNLSNEPLMTIKSQMMWDKDTIKIIVDGEYDSQEYSERELVGMIELEDTLQVFEGEKQLDSLEASSMATSLNLSQVLEDLRFIQSNEDKYPMDNVTSCDLRVYDMENFDVSEFESIDELNLESFNNTFGNSKSKAKEPELAL
ncbi:hypothetical protein R7Q39_22105 [Vibrio sp. 947]|uniref:hypothetical protein n=1 Tax=unclassified Vibrio TaxID=2614977 RepID=UPI002964B01C|nr:MULTISPECIES: hypothetical protein [unclassified Vibrio]MDW1583506.1 hypothetical protein [Vibrio sp. Vb2897]MDW1641890.1 hypothetical protein [Vibrio sp. Vb2896]MDW1928099.1 hypothetical protein [Vibrio sp. 947]